MTIEQIKKLQNTIITVVVLIALIIISYKVFTKHESAPQPIPVTQAPMKSSPEVPVTPCAPDCGSSAN